MWQDELRVLAHPAQSATPRPVAFQQGGGVAEGASADPGQQGAEVVQEPGKLVLHHRVVVLAQGVPRQPVLAGRDVTRREVVQGDGHHAACALDEERRVEPLVEVCRQVAHVGVAALVDPADEGIAVCHSDGLRRGHAACRKAEAQGFGFQQSGMCFRGCHVVSGNGGCPSVEHLELVALLHEPLDGARQGVHGVLLRLDGVVEGDDGAVAGVAFDLLEDLPSVEVLAVVACHEVPHHDAVASAQHLVLKPAHVSVWRTEEVCLDEFVCLVGVRQVVLRQPLEAPQVVEGVVAQTVSAFLNHGELARMFAHIVPDEKEGSLDAVVVEHVEHPRCHLGDGPVVERQVDCLDGRVHAPDGLRIEPTYDAGRLLDEHRRALPSDALAELVVEHLELLLVGIGVVRLALLRLHALDDFVEQVEVVDAVLRIGGKRG